MKMGTDADLSGGGRFVDIGGRRLHISCTGEGRPAIVLDAGMGDTLASWAPIQSLLAKTTTVLSYDRSGLGKSDPALRPRSLLELAGDLHSLLVSAEVSGPYVLVGHSFGAQIVRLFAVHYPLEVSGLVLVDPSHEEKYARFEAVLSEELIERQNAFLSDPSRNSEHIDLLASRLQLQTAKQILNAPLVVLSRGKADASSAIWPSEGVQRIELELQRKLLSTPGSGLRRHIIAQQSGHYIHHDKPELVLSTIKEMVLAIRQGRSENEI